MQAINSKEKRRKEGNKYFDGQGELHATLHLTMLLFDIYLFKLTAGLNKVSFSQWLRPGEG